MKTSTTRQKTLDTHAQFMKRQMLPHFDEANENRLGLRAMLEISPIAFQDKINSTH